MQRCARNILQTELNPAAPLLRHLGPLYLAVSVDISVETIHCCLDCVSPFMPFLGLRLFRKQNMGW